MDAIMMKKVLKYASKLPDASLKYRDSANRNIVSKQKQAIKMAKDVAEETLASDYFHCCPKLCDGGDDAPVRLPGAHVIEATVEAMGIPPTGDHWAILAHEALHQWTSDQDQMLLDLVEGGFGDDDEGDVIDWETIKTSFPDRSSTELLQRYYNALSSTTNTGAWTREEESAMFNLAQEYKCHNWPAIARELGTGRTPRACLVRYQLLYNTSLVTRGPWSKEEDKKLLDAENAALRGDWGEVMVKVSGRTRIQCRERWRKLTVRGSGYSSPWTDLQERQAFLAAISVDVLSGLRYQVQKNADEGTVGVFPAGSGRGYTDHNTWPQLAAMVPGKSKAQCRDRWFYTVDPSINWGAFTEEEEVTLMKLVDELGPGHWAEVARQLPGRIGVHVSARWKQLSDESEVHAYLRADRKRRCTPTIPKVKDKSTLGAEDFEVRLIAPSIDADILL